MFGEPLLVCAPNNFAHTLGQEYDAYVHVVNEERGVLHKAY